MIRSHSRDVYSRLNKNYEKRMFKLTSKDLISNLSGNKRLMTQGLNSCLISSATTKLEMTHDKIPPILNFEDEFKSGRDWSYPDL